MDNVKFSRAANAYIKWDWLTVPIIILALLVYASFHPSSEKQLISAIITLLTCSASLRINTGGPS